MNNSVHNDEKLQNRLLCCTLLGFGMSGALSQPLGSFIPFLRDSYNFSYDFSGVLLSCQSIGNLISILTAGLLPIYLGRRKSILLLSVWMGFAYFIFTSGIGNPLMLALACLMTGVSRGGNSNFSNVMISTLPSDKSDRGYNLLHGCFAVGALISPLLLVLLVKAVPGYGWRIMSGILLLVCTAQLVLYSFMPIPGGKPTKSIKAVDKSFFKSRSFWLAAMMLFFYISAEYAIVGWMVTYFQDIGVLNAQQAQLTGSLFWLFIFTGRMLGAVSGGKIPGIKLLLIDGCGQFAFFMLMLLSSRPLPVIIGLAGVALFMATIYPTAFSLGSKSIQGNDMGCSIMIFAGSAGGIIAPAAVGFVAEHAGIKAGMGLVACMSGLLLIAIILSALSHNKKPEAEN